MFVPYITTNWCCHFQRAEVIGWGREGREGGLYAGVCVCGRCYSVFMQHFQAKAGMTVLVNGPSGC